MERHTILLVEDKEIIRNNIMDILGHTYEFLEAGTRKEALGLLCDQYNRIKVILLDLYLPDSKGSETVHLLSKQFPDVPIIVMTVERDPHIAAEVIKKGAAEYIAKQKIFSEERTFIEIVSTTIKKSNMKKGDQSALLDTLFYNKKLKEALNRVKIAVKESLPVLLTGESGTGKSVLVKYLHQKMMPGTPLVTVDCGAIHENMIEAELFGHKRWAFTDARETRIGKIEMAHGGILFLDEISNASLQVQAKLLRVLQEKMITRLGENEQRPISFSLITATNKDLQKDITLNHFREDLYFRIKAVEIHFPALRESPERLEQYIHHFINVYNHQFSTNFIPDQTLFTILLTREWRGNLRELDMEIKKIVCFHSYGFDITDEDQYREEKEISGLQQETEEFEKWKIKNALRKFNGNISKAAKIGLEIPYATLQSKMRKYGISADKYIK